MDEKSFNLKQEVENKKVSKNNKKLKAPAEDEVLDSNLP